MIGHSSNVMPVLHKKWCQNFCIPAAGGYGFDESLIGIHTEKRQSLRGMTPMVACDISRIAPTTGYRGLKLRLYRINARCCLGYPGFYASII